jgi:uncharacterized cupin superfamily protein
MPDRPPFIVSSADVPARTHRYPNSDEDMAPARPIGRAAGLLRTGIHLITVAPGPRTSYPHAESAEEEFVYVVEGEIDAWIDGELHRMKAGDFAAFPSGTGICHTFLYYPLNPSRRGDIPWSRWWDDVPKRPLGPHDGKPRPR